MYAPIEQVKARYQRRISQYPGVVSVGIGCGDQGQKVLVVGVLEELSQQTRRKIPSILEGYCVQIKAIEV